MPPSESSHRGSPFAKELISHLEPHCTKRTTGRGEQLDLHVNGQCICYLIFDGSFAVYRQTDGMLLTTARGPSIIGIGNLSGVVFDDYLKTLGPCEIGVLPADKVNEIVEEKGLWGLLSNQLIFAYNRLYHNIMPRGGATAYEMIRHQLLELMNEDEQFRLSITAERYIRDKTQLSRSGIMRILADLKTGGYVEIEEGKLIRVHKLPAKY